MIACDLNPGAVGFPLATRRALVSTEDEQAVERLAAAERVDGIVAPGTDWPVAIAARVAGRLGLPHPLTPAAAALAVSKLRQRARFAEAGVAQPRYAVCRKPGDGARAWAELGAGLGGGGSAGGPFALVVKPTDRQGQAGIGVARSAAEAEVAVAEAVAASRGGICLAEALVAGSEVTVNAFSVGGRFVPITVTDRVTDPGRAFGVALAHVWPSALPAPWVEAAVRAAEAAAAALGISDGPTYTQIVVDGQGRPYVVELAARLGGGHDAELCFAAVGVDLAGLTVAAALGEAVDVAAARPLGAAPAGGAPGVGGAVTRFLAAGRAGVLAGVEGVAEATGLPGVVGVRIYRAPGAEVRELRRGNDRQGAILVVGGTRAEAVERAARAAAAVRFVVSDDGPDAT